MEVDFDFLHIADVADERCIVKGVVPIPGLNAAVVIVQDPLQRSNVVEAELFDQLVG